jgi:cyclohexanone monooxygenase
VKRVKADYDGLRQRASQVGFGIDLAPRDRTAKEDTPEERRREFETRWQKGGFGFLGAYSDIVTDSVANDSAQEFVREKIRQVVKDPAVAELLLPKTTIGCKRLCLDTNYFETFNRDNVTLVDVRATPIQEILPRGLRTSNATFELDDLILATGFDAMTGTLLRIDIRGAGGVTLGERWAEGPKTYLGLTTVGFPNLFMMTGPGSPSVLSNMVVSIEQHAEWIAECVANLRARGLSRIEATPEAQAAWVAHVNEVADSTLYPRCNSWYLGSNVPGKPRVFMPYLGFPAYVDKCRQVVAAGYEGFRLA